MWVQIYLYTTTHLSKTPVMDLTEFLLKADSYEAISVE